MLDISGKKNTGFQRIWYTKTGIKSKIRPLHTMNSQEHSGIIISFKQQTLSKDETQIHNTRTGKNLYGHTGM